jgi:vacuolar iron transporter family protein
MIVGITSEDDMTKQQRERDIQILSQRATQVQQGGARAAVLGVNDGLVSVLCIVLAVAAAGADQSAVLLAGFAGLIAGAVSMAAGEWISVQAQVELFRGVLKDLTQMLKKDRLLLEETLTEHLQSDGYSTATAKAATRELSGSEEHFYRTYAEQVIGINPDELGSPWVAAVSSFALFTLGALAPLASWFFIGGAAAIGWSIVLTSLGSFAAGAYVAYSSGKSLLLGALRQFFIVVLASVVTYGVGYLFGSFV